MLRINTPGLLIAMALILAGGGCTTPPPPPTNKLATLSVILREIEHVNQASEKEKPGAACLISALGRDTSVAFLLNSLNDEEVAVLAKTFSTREGIRAYESLRASYLSAVTKEILRRKDEMKRLDKDPYASLLLVSPTWTSLKIGPLCELIERSGKIFSMDHHCYGVWSPSTVAREQALGNKIGEAV